MDFNKASCKANKKVFPNIYIVKCFFHFTQCLYKKLKQLGLTKKGFKDDILEILFNLKWLSFIDPRDIPNIYRKIKNKYNKKNIRIFILISQKHWNQFVNLKSINSFLIGIIIMYKILRRLMLSIYFFLTILVTEHINKILILILTQNFPLMIDGEHL